MPSIEPQRFTNTEVTATGERRASVKLKSLKTLWFNTGTLCNLTCKTCYIESSPTNDRLVYLTAAEVAAYLDEIETQGFPTSEIGFTGGEPFMNSDFIDMVEDALQRHFRVLILTNAMKPMMKCSTSLKRLNALYGDHLIVRVSIDHYTREHHEAERGPRSWEPLIAGLRWLGANGFSIHVAGRTYWNQLEAELREGYAGLFAQLEIPVDAFDPVALVLFPEMVSEKDVPEISESCWGILGVDPDSVMCATSRMIVKRNGAASPSVVSCTLLPHDPRFELGRTLAEASRGAVHLNHPYCAQFCVLGGGSCSQSQEV